MNGCIMYNVFGLDFQMNCFFELNLDGITVEMGWDGMGYMVRWFSAGFDVMGLDLI